MPTTSSAMSELRMAPPEYYNDFGDVDDDDDDDDDVVDIDVDSLGDWRTFRRDLARSGIDGGSSSSSSSSSDGWDGEDEGKKKKKKTTTTKTTTTTTTGKKREEAARPSSVSKRNEELLRSQSEELAEEYATGVWAHEAPNPEVGGLACRLPLEAELYRNSDYSLIGRKLQGRLSLHDGKEEEEDDDDDNDGSSSAAPSGDDGTGTQASEPTPPGSSSPGVSFSPLAARTVFWYRAAQGLIREEMGRAVASIAEDNDNDDDDGTGTATIDVANLGPESAEMLGLYLDHQDAWQEVCLVLDRDEEGGGTGKATTVVLNRPMAFRATENLARFAVMGAYDPTEPTPTEEQARLLTLFLSAFDEEMGMYVGGPDMMEEPALMIHGIRDLEGAEEVAKGTGIYVGGLEAAVEGVAAGRYKPLDFRFFVGRHRYERGGLDLAVRLGKYQPVACARSVALKQCIALPKPLWHEVMELCGGELKEISNLELMKRNDLQIEEADE